MRSVLLDSNTLLLWIVGNLQPGKVGTGRLRAFDLDDLGRLSEFLDNYQKHVTLPNILTEVSNLLGSGNQLMASGGPEALAHYASKVAEQYQPSLEVVRSEGFLSLGLTDAAILSLQHSGLTVFTVDHELFGRLAERGVKVVNLFHYKTPK